MGKPKKKFERSSHVTQTDAIYKEKVKMVEKPYQALGNKPYPYAKLTRLIANLNSKNKKRQVRASEEYATNQDSISLALNKTTDFTETEVFNKVIDRIIKEQELLLKRLQKKKNKKALRFVAKTKALPQSVREKAADILSSIDESFAKEQRIEEARDEIRTRDIAESAPMEKTELKLNLDKLRSGDEEEKISSLITILDNYQGVMATANLDEEISEDDLEAEIGFSLREFGAKILEELGEKRNIELIDFLSTFSLAPKRIREVAAEIIEEVSLKEKEPEKEKPKKKVMAIPMMEASQYDVTAIKRLYTRLKKGRSPEALAAALEFLANYERIIEAVMKTPMLSVTDVTREAVKIISKNSTKVLDNLEKKKDKKALNFLAISEGIPKRICELAKKILKRIEKEKEGEEIALEDTFGEEQEEPEFKPRPPTFGAPPPSDEEPPANDEESE